MRRSWVCWRQGDGEGDCLQLEPLCSPFSPLQALLQVAKNLFTHLGECTALLHAWLWGGSGGWRFGNERWKGLASVLQPVLTTAPSPHHASPSHR